MSTELCNLILAGTKRVWMPDDNEAYIEVEVRELNGDKTTVETKDGRVSQSGVAKIRTTHGAFTFLWCSLMVKL